MRKVIRIPSCVLFLLTIFITSTPAQISVFNATCRALDAANTIWTVSVLTSAVKEQDVVSIALVNGATGKTVEYGQRIFVSSGVPQEITGIRLPQVPLNSSDPYVIIVAVNKWKNDGSFDRVVSTSADLSLVPLPAPTNQAGLPQPSRLPLQIKGSKRKKIQTFILPVRPLAGTKPRPLTRLI